MSTIVVSNISPHLQESHLKELFEVCGTIVSMDLSPTEPRTCTITFASPEHASAASLLSGTPLGDKELQVDMAPEASANGGGFSGEPIGLGESPDKEGLSNSVHLAATNLGLSAPLLLAATQKRQDEVARTIYVGNVPMTTSDTYLREFFQTHVGQVLYVKLAGEAFGKPSRFAFVEFETIDAAQRAMSLTGQNIHGNPIKVGKSNNPIFKPGEKEEEEKKKERMEQVKRQLAKINEKHVKPPEEEEEADKAKKKKKDKDKRSRSRSKGRKSRSGSRDRDRRRRRSRSRDRDRSRRDRDRDRARDRDRRSDRDRRDKEDRERRKTRYPSRSPLRPYRRPAKPKVDPHEGMFFDGYGWQPIGEVNTAVTGAAAAAQQVAAVHAGLLIPGAQAQAAKFPAPGISSARRF